MTEHLEPNERKSRSLTNRPAQAQTVLKLGEEELVLRDEHFEAIFGMLINLKPHLDNL